MAIIILFMYIFSFKVFNSLEAINSSLLVGLILGLFFVFKKQYRSIVFKWIKNRKVLKILIFLLFIITYSLFITTIHLAYDFSIIKTFINQIVFIYIGILVYSFYAYKKIENKLVWHLILVFIIQSMIQVISFISPVINEFLNQFRNENAIIRGQLGYGGIRGLSISGSVFFGLAAAYGLVLFYYIVNWKNLFKEWWILRYIFFGILIFGGISAGRSSIAGIFVGVIYIILNYIFRQFPNFKLRLKLRPFNTFISIILIFVMVISFSILIQNDYVSDRINKMNRFAFQVIYNFQESGKFTTSSTDVLFNRMYYPVDGKTFLIGDGNYTNDDGSYYGKTDAGYMRNILFFGIVGLIALLIYQLMFFVWNSQFLLQNFMTLVYILIMHIKGEVLGFLIIFQSILFILYLRNLEISKKKYDL